MKLVLNFGHPLTKASMQTLQTALDSFAYVHQRLSVRFERPLQPQIVACVNAAEKQLMEKISLSLESVGHIYMVCPGMSDPTALLVMEIIGRTGNFPGLVFQKRDLGTGQFEVYEVADGFAIKNAARGRRSGARNEGSASGT